MSTAPGERAFPVDDPRKTPQRGMTLRDYFAGRAMQGMIALGNCSADEIPKVAAAAYAIADAMLVAREKSS